MKTQNNFSLLLQKLCNRRNGTTGTFWLKGSKLFGLLTILLLLPFAQAKADYFYEYSKYFEVTQTVGNEAGALDIHLIGLDKDGDNDRMHYVTVCFSTDNGSTWNDICYYMVDNQDLTGNTFSAYASKSKNSINYNLGFIQDNGVHYSNGSLQAYIDLRWYFPDKIKGKKIIIGIRGCWERNYATGSPTHDGFDCRTSTTYTRRTIQLFDYSTTPIPTCTIVPKVDGNFKLTWDKAGTYLSKFELYSGNYASLAGSVAGTAATGEGSVKLGLLNQENAYTLKKVYETPKDVSGFSVRYEQNIGKVTHTGYSYPINLAANFDPCTKKATLTWGNTTPLNYDTKSKLFIYRRLSGQTFYTLVNTTGLNIDRTDYTDPEELQFDKTYNYIIRSYADIFDISNSVLTSTSADTLLPELLSKQDLITQRQTIFFDGFSANAIMPSGSIPAKIAIKWSENWCSDNSKTIKIHKYNTVTKVTTTTVVQSKDETYDDMDVLNEVPYHYRLDLDNASVTVYSPWDTIDNVITDKASFVRFSTTKGVYNDRIKLLWEIDKPLLNTKFIVHRKAYGDSIFTNVYEKESQNKIENWEDLSVSPGILYQYQLESYYVTSLGKVKQSFSPDTLGLGFCQPSATVSGSITFGSGTCVENVNVSIENNDLTQQLYSCINFKNQDVKKGEGNILFQKSKHGCIHTGFTWQAWIRPQNRTQENVILYELNGEYSIRLNSNDIEVYDGSATGSTKLLSAGINDVSTSEFFQLTVTYNPATKLFEIYINGALMNTATFDTPACSNPERASAKLAASFNAELNHFKGSIDEMRLWNRRLNPDEILKNFDRYLSGTETDLVGYWQMDEGLNNYVFDRSNKSKTYNEHHITLSNANTSAFVPTTNQLSIKATTDKNGNYIIQGVPYKGNGSSYHVTPIFGTHTFQPSSQLIFIGGASSEVQSAVSFKDISSFIIKGTINYENTDYPVEDVE
ncbi:MAG TPA: LamG domain-containing protein, partial [Paludibacter sp.]|nr:LamG domain-containing protein [Paludibacter sp.]